MTIGVPAPARHAEAVAALGPQATRIGFDAIDMGPLSAVRDLEPLAMVWIHLAFKQGLGRRFAFARITRA